MLVPLVGLPSWDWKAKQLKPKTQHVNIHHKFTNILDNHGLIQLVEEPTRGTNILDLIITNYPESFVLYGIFLLILSSNADVKWFQISFADASSSYSLLVVACVFLNLEPFHISIRR
jgi:hypothetical protein